MGAAVQAIIYPSHRSRQTLTGDCFPRIAPPWPARSRGLTNEIRTPMLPKARKQSKRKLFTVSDSRSGRNLLIAMHKTRYECHPGPGFAANEARSNSTSVQHAPPQLHDPWRLGPGIQIRERQLRHYFHSFQVPRVRGLRRLAPIRSMRLRRPFLSVTCILRGEISFPGGHAASSAARNLRVIILGPHDLRHSINIGPQIQCLSDV